MLNMKTILIASTLFSVLGLAAPAYEQEAASVRKTLTEMVAADTSNPPGNEARLIPIIGKRLKDEGIAYDVVEFAPGRQNLVARLRAISPGKGPGTGPIMLLAHLDVVGTQDQSWASDPHTVVEKDGYLIGRGVSDDLGMAAINLEVFLMLKRSGVALRRDVILAFTGDEESGGTGIQYLLKHRPELIDAEIAINEGGSPELGDNGNVKLVNLQSAEKTYQDFLLTAKGTTGHSSVPLPDNAINRLAKALDKLGKADRPARLMPVTRAYFETRAGLEKPVLAGAFRMLSRSKGALPKKALQEIEKDPALRIQLRSTCVATMIEGGTKENALPPEAHSTVNCRILPDESIADIQKWIVSVVADSGVEIKTTGEPGAVVAASNPQGELPTVVEKIAAQMWPGAPVIPSMSGGATDSRYLRKSGVASYGIGPLAMLKSDARRAHGIDERIPVSSIRPGIDFLNRVVIALAVTAK